MNAFLSKHRSLASWLILLGLVALVLMVLVAPLLDRHEKYQFELARDGRTLQRFQSIAGSRGQLEIAHRQFQERGLGQWVFPAATAPAAIELDIQRRVSDAIATSKAQVRSIAPLNAQSRNGYMTIGVRATFSGSMPNVMGSLDRLESSLPLLVIQDFRINPSLVRARPNAPEEQLVEVQMSVVTFVPVDAGGGAQ
ncbi:type II secretion system protein GspM [Pseudomonas sp. RIT-PI-AD]|uniref:type II secretion system protein GspM n=1 Tax=Pseudomonas sp. RIT-PI-AD TaxID=3035294 RepID=UPI0021DB3580|nr:type II secretion system protein GspM [Pseudomonas sp. RIT-PI-AD]